MKVRSIKQKARIILNSDDAIKTVNNNHIIPVREEPIRFDGAVGTVVDLTNNRINVLDHRFNTGDVVVYSCTGTVMTTNPAGLMPNNATLYVIAINPNIIALATSAANATAGTAIDITVAGTGTHSLTRTVTFNGSVDTVVNVNNDTITVNAHSLNTGDYVQYNTTGTAITGLTNNRYYYVIKVDDNTFELANSFQEATSTPPSPVNLQGLGTGTTHNIRKIVSFDSTVSPVVDIVNERIQIPSHPFSTGDYVLYQVDAQGYGAGTVIGGLVDNMYYYVISVDPDTIRLADTRANALAGTAINLTAIGTGGNHSLTRFVTDPIGVCTNYKFKLNNLPNNLDGKCRLAVQSFDYVKNYATTNCKSVGGVYLKNILPPDTYSSQGHYKGTLILPAYFGNSFSYQNSDLEYNSIALPNNISQFLQEGIDVFVDCKKRNFGNQDISGCINDDTFNLSLIIYELEDFEYLYQDMSEKQRNYVNIALS